MATDFLRNMFKLKDLNNNDEDDLKTGMTLSRSSGDPPPPVLNWNQDPSMIMISRSVLVYYIIIVVLSLGMIIMFVEYRRSVKGIYNTKKCDVLVLIIFIFAYEKNNHCN